MITVVHELLRGRRKKLGRGFSRAFSFWKEFHKKHRKSTQAELTEAIGVAQIGFEKCFGGDRATAKPVMAVTCLGTIYDKVDGMKQRQYALKLLKAFEASNVSGEVKHQLPLVRLMYHLDD